MYVVTGAKGFLGSKIIQLLKNKGCNAIGLSREECDLASRQEVSDFFSTINVKLIIHCAAFVPSLLEEYQDVFLSKKNTLLLENILYATTCPIIYISSMTVYGPSKEASRKESELLNPQSEYAKSKSAGEELLQADGRDSLAIRLPGLFGESRNSGLIYNNVTQLAHSIKPSFPSEPLLWAAMDVHDAAISIVIIIEKFNFSGFEAINIGYRDCYSLNLLVDIYSKLFNYPIEYEIEHPKFKFDLSKVDKVGAVPAVDLFSAIKRYKDRVC